MPDNTKMKPVTNEKEKLMYESASQNADYKFTGLTATKVQSGPDTIPQQLDSLMKAASELRQMCGMAADKLSGPIPEPKDCCEAQDTSTIQYRLREINYALSEAIANQQRVMRSLAL